MNATAPGRICLGLALGCALLASAAWAVPLDLGPAAAARGQEVFVKNCRSCHGLRYLGQSPALSPKDARSAFGRVPPDLSLMTLARGRGTTGAKYVYSLLTSFSDTPEWNRVLPGIAMPDPFRGQSGAEAQARDVAAFLYRAADPHAAEGRTLGRYVLGYMAVLTFLLFLVNRRIWRELAAGRV